MRPCDPPTNAHVLISQCAVVTALSLFLGLVGAPFLYAQAGKSNKEEISTVRGIVVNSVTHAPVGHALVYSNDNRFAKLTDDQGRFEFKVPRPADGQTSQSNIGFFFPTGQMTTVIAPNILFMARKPGYLETDFAQSSLDVDSSESSEIKISLMPESLIIGRVNLPSNDGTDKIQVEIYRREVQEGRVHWNSVGTVSTRANGEFRFANLREGEYKLFTQELLDRDPLTFDPRGQLFGYPPVYYPSAADFETAASIHLKAGETFSATLSPSRREYYPVKLGVLNAALAGGYRITVERQGHRGPGYSLGFDPNENSIVGMLPNGNYTVEATQYGENAAAGTLNFSVNGAPAQGPSLMLVPNSSIELRVNDERANSQNATAPNFRNDLGMFNLTLVPRDEFSSSNTLRLQPPKNQEDNSLAFGNAQPGSYWVRASCHPSAYLAAVTSSGKDLLRQPLEVAFGASIPPIEITIRDDGAQVDGTIENWPRHGQDDPARNSTRVVSAVVVLLPVAENSGQFCQSWVTPTADFRFPIVPPGEYRAIAFDHMPENLPYDNAEAMRKHDAKGQVLRLVPGQKAHLRLILDTWSD